MKRSLIREHLFKLLFRIEFNEPEDMPQQVRLYFEDGFADEDHKSTGADIPEKDRPAVRNQRVYRSICVAIGLALIAAGAFAKWRKRRLANGQA